MRWNPHKILLFSECRRCSPASLLNSCGFAEKRIDVFTAECMFLPGMLPMPVMRR